MNQIKLNPKYTFDNYAVGDFNELSYSIAKLETVQKRWETVSGTVSGFGVSKI